MFFRKTLHYNQFNVHDNHPRDLSRKLSINVSEYANELIVWIYGKTPRGLSNVSLRRPGQVNCASGNFFTIIYDAFLWSLRGHTIVEESGGQRSETKDNLHTHNNKYVEVYYPRIVVTNVDLVLFPQPVSPRPALRIASIVNLICETKPEARVAPRKRVGRRRHSGYNKTNSFPGESFR